MHEKIPDITFNHTTCTRDFKIMTLDAFFAQGLDEIYKPHRLKFFQMIYICEGTGYHTVDFNTISLTKGSLFFSSPNQVQIFQKDHTYSGYICIFTEAFLNREFLHKEFIASYKNAKEEVPVSLLRVILHKSKEHFISSAQGNQSNELFNSFKKILLSQFYEVHTAEEYATLLNISPKHLNVTCKQITGLTTKAFIDKFKIVEIKRYLASSTLPIHEIATNMGYWEVSNFVKFFKKHTGLTPKTFRNTNFLA